MYKLLYLSLLVIWGTQLPAKATRNGGEAESMSEEERIHFREEAKEMFYHAYNAYMENAYPADELMPLSCKGRYRDTLPSRGDIDETLGNFSLTLIDSLDTLVVLGDIEEFDRGVRLVVKDVTFDHDLVVSVFETNIRVVGGLLSAHIMAEHLNQLYGALGWYRSEMLTMAKDIATRLLPAFNTTTGIPHGKVNLRYGMKSPQLANSRDTCTACAGTIILEFAALSRLTGDPIFEDKARQAMTALWTQRHRGSDLMGTVLNVHSGDWVRRDSGVGAGIDSYYEYLLKAYVLLGDESYLQRFNKHYSAVMKYISQGPMLLDVHMHRPHTTSSNFMSSLLAFWPGLQVLKGDIKPAIETHEMLYQVIQRHNFLPEAFTTDFQVHWGQHPLRPEFLESTYILYQATGDPYYLRVGEQVLRSLQKHAWVPCGYAAVKDVRTGVHEDRMDSFVLAETFKYLYLLFALPSELIIDVEEFVFTTEAHLLPLSLARLSNLTEGHTEDTSELYASDSDVEYARSCPNSNYLFPERHEFAQSIRKPLKNFVNNVCPSRKTIKRKLRASEFQAGNAGHLSLLRDMGITIMALPDGRVQLLHTASNGKSSDDAEEGLLFMQEMIELSKLQQEQPENPPRLVSFMTHKTDPKAPNEKIETITTIQAGPAQFGMDLKGKAEITGQVIRASPLRACGQLDNTAEITGKIVIMERGDCMFIEKARRVESLGAVGGIVLDNTPGTSATNSPMFAMSGDGTDDIKIPMVFLFSGDAQSLLQAMEEDPGLEIVLSDYSEPTTGIGSVEEVHVELENLAARVTEALTANTQLPNSMLLPSSTKKTTIPKDAKALLLKEIDSTDDLVTAVENDQDSENKEKKPLSPALSAVVEHLEKADTAEEILVAAVRYINVRQSEEPVDGTGAESLVNPPSASLVAELQQLMLKKTKSKPGLLRTLLGVHFKELMSVVNQVKPSSSDPDTSLQNLLRILGHLTTSHHQIKELTTEKTKHTTNLKQDIDAQNKEKELRTYYDAQGKKKELLTDEAFNNRLEDLKSTISAFKKKYEGIIPQNIESVISDLQDTASTTQATISESNSSSSKSSSSEGSGNSDSDTGASSDTKDEGKYEKTEL